ncbi:MAG: hypothetical protein ACRYHA_11945 [Janthinobacterium lividum]
MKIRESSLAKLTLTAYQNPRLSEYVGTVEAMYNPGEIALDYAASYQERRALNDISNANVFIDAPPGTLSVQLVFDGQLPGSRTSVDARLTELRQLCGIIDGVSRQTRYLKVQWGKLGWHGDGYFAGRMQQLAIRYTLFDRDGSPLRATASLTLIEDRDPDLQRARHGLTAQHFPVAQVPAATPLPLIATAAMSVSGDMADKAPVDYLTLALANDLDHLDALVPGQMLAWPADGQTP